MASRKRQGDKNLKVLRELVTQTHNKKCFDCGQRGPTYVNMTIGAFVCTSCSGLLRGLNPPHRIKSISMASFSEQEIEFLQKHGNEVCRNIWLALWENSSIENESREGQKMKDHLVHKYERKVWYSDQKPTPTVVSQLEMPVAKPLKTILGSNFQPVFVAPVATQKSPLTASTTTPVSNVSRFEPPKAQSDTNMDLLSNLSNDPFASTPADNSYKPSMYSFPKPATEEKPAPFFEAFTSSDDSRSQDSFDLFVNCRPNQPAASATILNTTPSVPQDNSSDVDKYAALAELDMNNTQSIFSSSSLFGNSPATCTRSQPNPFMSPSINSSGAAVFQQQQQKPANPFQSSSIQPTVLTSQSTNMFYPPSVDTSNQSPMYSWDMSNTQMNFDRSSGYTMTTSNPNPNPMVTSNQLNSNFLMGDTQQLGGQQPFNIPNQSAMPANPLVFPNQTQGFVNHFNNQPNQLHGQKQSQTFPRQPISQSLFQPQSTNQNQYFSMENTQPSLLNNSQAVFNSPFQPFHSDPNQITKNPATQDQMMFGSNNMPVNAPVKSTNPFM